MVNITKKCFHRKQMCPFCYFKINVHLSADMLRLCSDFDPSAFLLAGVLLFLAVSGGGPMTFDPNAIWEESRGVGPCVMVALTAPVSSSKQTSRNLPLSWPKYFKALQHLSFTDNEGTVHPKIRILSSFTGHHWP